MRKGKQQVVGAEEVVLGYITQQLDHRLVPIPCRPRERVDLLRLRAHGAEGDVEHPDVEPVRRPVDGLALVAQGFAAVVILAFLVEMARFTGPGGAVERIALAVWVIAYLGLLPCFLVQLQLGRRDAVPDRQARQWLDTIGWRTWRRWSCARAPRRAPPAFPSPLTHGADADLSESRTAPPCAQN